MCVPGLSTCRRSRWRAGPLPVHVMHLQSLGGHSDHVGSAWLVVLRLAVKGGVNVPSLVASFGLGTQNSPFKETREPVALGCGGWLWGQCLGTGPAGWLSGWVLWVLGALAAAPTICSDTRLGRESQRSTASGMQRPGSGPGATVRDNGFALRGWPPPQASALLSVTGC